MPNMKKQTGLKALLVATVIGVPALGVTGKYLYDSYFNSDQGYSNTLEENQNLTPEKNKNLTTVPTHVFTPEEDRKIAEQLKNIPKEHFVVDSKGTRDGVFFDWCGGKEYAEKNGGVYVYEFPATDRFPKAHWYVEDTSYDIRYSNEAKRAFFDNRLVVCPAYTINPEGKKVIWGEFYQLRKNPVDRTKLDKGSRIPDLEELSRFYDIK